MHQEMKNRDSQAFVYEIIKSLDTHFNELKYQFNNKRIDTNTKFFVLDNLLDISSANYIHDDIITANNIKWSKKNTFREKKSGCKDIRSFNQNVVNIFKAFEDKKVISLISKITSIKDLQSDPSLYAAGISKMKYGDFLNPHIDNSHDGTKSLYRRLNLLFYISPNIKSEHGGNLELWDKKIKREMKLAPIFNRLIIMETNRDSWHSVDKIINKDIERICITTYYFSKNSPENYHYKHVTSFLGRPDQVFLRGFSRIDNYLRQKADNILTLIR